RSRINLTVVSSGVISSSWPALPAPANTTGTARARAHFQQVRIVSLLNAAERGCPTVLPTTGRSSSEAAGRNLRGRTHDTHRPERLTSQENLAHRRLGAVVRARRPGEQVGVAAADGAGGQAHRRGRQVHGLKNHAHVL